MLILFLFLCQVVELFVSVSFVVNVKKCLLFMLCYVLLYIFFNMKPKWRRLTNSMELWCLICYVGFAAVGDDSGSFCCWKAKKNQFN